MSGTPEPSPEATTASLMAGIILDLQTLFEQRLKLMQLEVEHELRLRARATAACAIGLGILFIASIVFSFGLVHLLNWMASSEEQARELFSLWFCHAIVGALLTLTGTVIAWFGMRMLRSHVSFSD